MSIHVVVMGVAGCGKSTVAEAIHERLGRFLEGIFQTIDLKELKIELVVQAYEPGNFMTYMDMLSSNRFSGAMICGKSQFIRNILNLHLGRLFFTHINAFHPILNYFCLITEPTISKILLSTRQPAVFPSF